MLSKKIHSTLSFLRRYKYLLYLVWLIGTYTNVSAQRTGRVLNLPNYDNRKIHYGFQIGLFNSTLNARPTETYGQLGDTVRYFQGNSNFGFSLGFILNLKLKDELWSVRFLPNVAFYENSVSLEYKGGRKASVPLQATLVELPLVFKYRSLRRRNHRFYLIGGGSVGFQVGGKRPGQDKRNLSLSEGNYEVTYGIGTDLYFTMFKFAPEIRFSHGLTNVMTQNDGFYGKNIDYITTHKIALILNFE
jgi:hypothetical protein